MNADFQRTARRDKRAFLSDQCKETEEKNRDLFKKIKRYQGNISCKDGLNKGQKWYGTEADGKNTWKNCTKKIFMTKIIMML